jgi:hypothetical protein
LAAMLWGLGTSGQAKICLVGEIAISLFPAVSLWLQCDQWRHDRWRPSFRWFALPVIHLAVVVVCIAMLVWQLLNVPHILR